MNTTPDDDHYGAEVSMADEMECSVCGWPYAPANPACGHETDD